jgi:ubiquitin thioesterase OTU1
MLRDPELHSALREVVVGEISKDPLTYNEAILGQDPHAYQKWIATPNAWGGAIELSLFSKHFETGDIYNLLPQKKSY